MTAPYGSLRCCEQRDGTDPPAPRTPLPTRAAAPARDRSQRRCRRAVQPTRSRRRSRSRLRAGAVRPRHAQQAPARRCRSCCAWPPLRRVGARALAARARLRRGGARDLHRARAQGSRARHVEPEHALHGTERFLPFAYLLTALLFARSGLYAERAQRPGLSRIVGSLFQVAFVALHLRGRQRRTLLELLPLLRLARVRAASTCPRCGRPMSGSRRCCCGPPATGAGRCSSARASTSPTSPTRSATRRTRRSRSSATSRPTPLPANGLRSLGTLARPRRGARRRARRRGDHRRPRLPPGRGRGARRPVPPARRARAPRALDDGDPDPPRRVRAGPVGAAVRARPARVRGHRLRPQAHLRHRSGRRCCWSC